MISVELGRSINFELRDRIQINMIWIPRGTFTMGNPQYEKWKKKHDPYDQPPVQIELTHGFWLSESKITMAHWLSFFCNLPPKYKEAISDEPIWGVNWHEAIAFCELLNTMFASALPRDYWFSLPTEAQWEYGCKKFCEDKKLISGMMETGFEWCYDGFGPYPENDTKDWFYDLGYYDSLRIVRGSKPNELERYLCSSRLELLTRAHLDWVGFRVALRHI